MPSEPPANITFKDGWVDSPNERGTLDILWSCFFTIFVCTWTALHLNLPAREESRWHVFWRKTKWMVLNVLFPEVVTAAAFAQRVAASESVAGMRKHDHSWTMRHAFFLNMGGLWLQPKNSQSFPINAQQLEYLVANNHLDLLNLSDREIWDKSSILTCTLWKVF
ncbi:hypothetical protein AJ80_02019 [Polytolypa hystricis UAMH7299]|uniref:Uncharacterized protein n=1 Tax=Polytolypa hystricis (strain UAMH7299) TaxID=1447883 RepID=A0A2B7YTJ8_POLH7|nr:hypothetical protein AJ80_02019 [Polytolypa hystricis UAMH7299]